MLTFGSIINGAFRHFRERPLAVLIWGVIYAVVTMAYSLAVMPLMLGRLNNVQGDPSAITTAVFGMMLPLYLIMLILTLVLIAASLRTILRPGEDSLAGIRFGMDELRLLGLFALLTVAFIIIAFVGAIVAGGIGGVIAVALGGSRVGLVALLPIIAFYAAIFYLMVRLSLVSALTMLRRKIVIGESWRLTRGHFWRLFGAYFVLGVMLFVVYAILFAVTVGPIYAQMFSHGFSPQAMGAANQAQLQRQFGGFSVMSLVTAIGGGLVVALSYAVWGGAAATATQDLIGTTDVDLAETFA